MMQNPVYSREMKVSSRSIRLPLIIVLFNGILSMVTLLNMYSAVAQVESTAVIQYSSFMDMYEFVTTIEFILLMFIVPAVTAASISGERERQTLELMLTTQMTASSDVYKRQGGNWETDERAEHAAFADCVQFPGSGHGICLWGNHLAGHPVPSYVLYNSGLFCGKPGNLFLSPVQAVNHIHGSYLRSSDSRGGRDILHK